MQPHVCVVAFILPSFPTSPVLSCAIPNSFLHIPHHPTPCTRFSLSLSCSICSTGCQRRSWMLCWKSEQGCFFFVICVIMRVWLRCLMAAFNSSMTCTLACSWIRSPVAGMQACNLSGMCCSGRCYLWLPLCKSVYRNGHVHAVRIACCSCNMPD